MRLTIPAGARTAAPFGRSTPAAGRRARSQDLSVLTPNMVPHGTGAAAAPGERALGLFTPAGAVMCGVLGAAFIALFHRWIYFQHLHSLDKPHDWGHSYIVLLFSGYLVWRQRERIAAARPGAFWPALGPMLLGIMAHFFAVVGIRNHMVQGFSMLLTLFGATLLVLGPGPMRYLFLPIAFLVFGITVSEQIMIHLTFQLQLIASYGAWIVLSLVSLLADFAVEVGGNTIKITTSSGEPIPLDVAAACSGMRMVVAFFALAGMTAILGCRYWWQRAALVLLAAPVAVLINIGRVSALGLLSLSDPELSKGGAHMLIGTLLLVPGLLLFMLIVWALNKAVRDDGPRSGA